MSKYYKAEDLQKALIGFIRRTGIVELPYDYATDVLDSLPTIDIVRCEDCIYYSKKELGFRKCTQSGLHVTYDDYCSYGERE